MEELVENLRMKENYTVQASEYVTIAIGSIMVMFVAQAIFCVLFSPISSGSGVILLDGLMVGAAWGKSWVVETAVGVLSV